MPRYSIIVPCRNAEDTLPLTLQSLCDQTFTDWEALLVDDGSTDATRLLLDAAATTDPRFRVIAGLGAGPAVARNMAMTVARGEILAFCDADDMWAPEKLTRLDVGFADGGIAALYSRIAFFDEGTVRTLSRIPEGPLTVPQLLGENPVCTMSNIAVRTDVFAETGGFDETMVHNEDLEWLIRLVAAGHRTVGVGEVLTFYRTSPTGLSADLASMRRGREAALATARALGYRPARRHEAIHLRYLARRALRVDAPGAEALRFVLAGLRHSPSAYFSCPRRGVLTLAGAIAAPFLPRRLRRFLFAS